MLQWSDLYVCVSSLVCMVGDVYVHVDMVFGFYVFCLFIFLFSWMFQHDCSDTCCFESYMHVLYFWICTSSAQLSIFHMERRSRNTLIIIIIIIICSFLLYINPSAPLSCQSVGHMCSANQSVFLSVPTDTSIAKG